MVGLGMLMIATGVIAIVLYFKKRLFDTRCMRSYIVDEYVSELNQS